MHFLHSKERRVNFIGHKFAKPTAPSNADKVIWGNTKTLGCSQQLKKNLGFLP
jgi:hypothetical protein